MSDELPDVLVGQEPMALRFGAQADNPSNVRRLGSARRTFIGSSTHLARAGMIVAPEDLLRHNCLSFNLKRVEPGWHFRGGEGDYLLSVGGSIEKNNGGTLVQLTVESVGTALFGSFRVEAGVAADRLVTLLEALNVCDTGHIHAVFVGGAGMR